jgi:outer membrane immunogenic protein
LLGARKVLASIVPPHFSWTGCYIGGHIGGGWGRKTVSIPDLAFTAGVPPGTLPPGFSVPCVTGNTSGVLGGGQVGCNYQFAPNWVIGIEGDGSAADIKGGITDTVSFAGIPITGTANARTDWLATSNRQSLLSCSVSTIGLDGGLESYSCAIELIAAT